MTPQWTRAASVFTLAATAAVAVGIAVAPAAHGDPFDCDFARDCSYDPPWNGPLLNPWDTPGSNGGWSNVPQICDPTTHRCGQFATP